MSESRSVFSVRMLGLGLALTGALAMPAAAAAGERKLVASDGAAGDAFGASVALDGDTTVVGAPGVLGGQGAVYVFQRVGNDWTRVATLTASDATVGGGSGSGDDSTALGTSVAIQGDTIVAGAPGANVGGQDDAGAIYTFARSGAGTRTETAILTFSRASQWDDLGATVAVDGDTIVAGAPCVPVSGRLCAGALLTFTRDGAAARTETAALFASNGGEQENLGSSLAIDGDTIVSGAPNKEAGIAYTFAREGAAERTETARLTAPDTVFADRFGDSVAIKGDAIVVGAPQADVGGRTSQGAAYTFARTGAVDRTPTAKLTASDGSEHALFGSSVAVDDRIVVGQPGVVGARGSLYTFAFAGADRTETGKLVAYDGAENDGMGAAVEVEGDTIVAGVAGWKKGRGSVSVFFPGEDGVVPRPDTVDPTLGALKLRPARFKRGRATRIHYRLSESAQVRFRVQRLRGRRYVTLRGSFAHAGRPGRNSLRYRGRLAGRRLTPGRYRLVAVPRDDFDNTGSTKRRAFRIVR